MLTRPALNNGGGVCGVQADIKIIRSGTGNSGSQLMRQKSGCSLVGGQLCQILVLCSREPVKVPVTVNPTCRLLQDHASLKSEQPL